jgi:hypothetical protein
MSDAEELASKERRRRLIRWGALPPFGADQRP